MNYQYRDLLIWAAGINYHVRHGRSRKQILFAIDFRLQPSEIVTITGSSGSGKSTLLSLFGALRSHQEGELYIVGQEMRAAKRSTNEAIKKKLGFIFQEANLLDSLSAVENVCVGFSASMGSSQLFYERAIEMLCRLNLETKINHYPRQLSGGQKQRVAIARALLRRPQLILADEPTASLDADSASLVMELFQRETVKNRSGLVLVTHDARIFPYAHRTVEIEAGRHREIPTTSKIGGKQRLQEGARSPLRAHRQDPMGLVPGSHRSCGHSLAVASGELPQL
jgi:putative ABC transport system ATP-binding protein